MKKQKFIGGDNNFDSDSDSVKIFSTNPTPTPKIHLLLAPTPTPSESGAQSGFGVPRRSLVVAGLASWKNYAPIRYCIEKKVIFCP
jgi:hypothetical protein